MTDKIHREQRNEKTDAIPEAMRCQYSSKRCDNERTHKKSGGLHKFCAMHREKANRNQMRLDQRRRVIKQQQKERQRQQLAHQMQQIHSQMQPMHRVHRPTSAVMAAGQNFHYGNRMQQHSPVGAMRTPGVVIKPMSPLNMNITMTMPMQFYPTMGMQPQTRQPTPNLPLFDQLDLDILEAMLFSSDEEQNDAHTITASQFICSPSIVNV